MRQDSPIPVYMLRDPITGPKVLSQELAIQEFMHDDEALAAEFIEKLAERGLHGELVTRGWSGLPIDAAILPITAKDELIVDRKKGAAAQLKLTLGDILRLPGYSSGYMSRMEALHEAQTKYDTHVAAQKAACETAIPLPK